MFPHNNERCRCRKRPRLTFRNHVGYALSERGSRVTEIGVKRVIKVEDEKEVCQDRDT